jgi:hypothetical protein
MAVGQPDPFPGKPVEVRSLVYGIAIAGQVAVTEVIGQENNKPGSLLHGFVIER